MEIADLGAVFALGERLFRAEDYPNLYRAWEEYELLQHYATEPETCLVAELGGEVVGFVLGSVIDKARSAWRYGYVVWLGVDPATGRRGVASRLLARLTEEFVAEGARILLADTEASNEPAIAFFTRQGFAKQRQHVYLEKNLETDPHWADEVRAAREERKRVEAWREMRRKAGRSFGGMPSAEPTTAAGVSVEPQKPEDHARPALRRPSKRKGRK